MHNSTIIFQIPEQQNLLADRFKTHKTLFNRDVLNGVLTIFDEIAKLGDEGVRKMTRQYDGVALQEMKLDDNYIASCIAGLNPALRSAIDQAIRNVQKVNAEMLPKSWEKEIRPGTLIGEKVTPLDSVGIWIPARKGPLISTAIMLVTAAQIAGVRKIVVGMPPLPDGFGDPGTVAAAKLAGADQFVIGNGVSVIAGFAQGTASIPEVDGIYGPGPGGIAAAMSIAMTYGKKSVLGIGPSESAIIADETADPLTIAYDLINEAEHGPDSSTVLVTASVDFAFKVESLIWNCIGEVKEKRRQNLQQVFGAKGKGAIIIVSDLDAACEFVNWLAPEHLMVVCDNDSEKLVLNRVRNAGEILIGEYTPFSAANYAIGITAVLPTNHFAKAFSGITAKDMIKYSTIGKLDKTSLEELFPIIQQLGNYEQLPCHIKSAEIRLWAEGLHER
ncbi:histidinol dehydrogenase [Paenibacillus pasadenensis]|uniref:histidinol dehydrogenase n=1 Tax=Paenibacillus pasadenensis TaxID=217090 RepID=UPI00203C4C95|nr:histidinol dehydrogenase [Paenibacillus pasadenensis]MCM3745772.1 histidinol dehydrogenase [Paenibacillus pasadenensis]